MYRRWWHHYCRSHMASATPDLWLHFRLRSIIRLKLVKNWRTLWKNRTSRYISFFPAHHSMVFYFRCPVYWWKGSVRF